MKNKTLIITIIIVLAIIGLIFGFVDFNSKLDETTNLEDQNSLVLNQNEQGYINLQSADDDFATIEDALNALDS